MNGKQRKKKTREAKRLERIKRQMKASKKLHEKLCGKGKVKGYATDRALSDSQVATVERDSTHARRGRKKPTIQADRPDRSNSADGNTLRP